MNEIKYIYFEIKYVKGIGETKPKIENANALLFEPTTNSSGVWGFTSITERRGFSEPTYSIVDQYWIDLEKFAKEKHPTLHKLKLQVDEVLEALNKKYYENPLL